MQEGVSTGSSSAPISPKAGSNDDSGANSSYSSSSSLKQEKSVKIEDESPSRTESAEADKTSLPASKNDIDSVSVVTTAASIANQVTSSWKNEKNIEIAYGASKKNKKKRLRTQKNVKKIRIWPQHNPIFPSPIPHSETLKPHYHLILTFQTGFSYNNTIRILPATAQQRDAIRQQHDGTSSHARNFCSRRNESCKLRTGAWLPRPPKTMDRLLHAHR